MELEGFNGQMVICMKEKIMMEQNKGLVGIYGQMALFILVIGKTISQTG